MNRTESVDNVNFESHSLFCESCNDEDKCITYIVKNVMTNESFQFSDGNEESIESILQKAKLIVIYFVNLSQKKYCHWGNQTNLW